MPSVFVSRESTAVWDIKSPTAQIVNHTHNAYQALVSAQQVGHKGMVYLSSIFFFVLFCVFVHAYCCCNFRNC